MTDVLETGALESSTPVAGPTRRGIHRATRSSGPTVPQGAVVVALSSVLTVPILGLWQMQWSVPLFYSGDTNSWLSLFKGVVDHGWYLRNPNLGAPFGQDYRVYPFGDNLLLVLGKVLSPFIHDSATLVNVIFLLTFPAGALAAWWVLRRMGLSNLSAVGIAILFTFLPYHFWRGEQHLSLSGYWVVPLAVYLLWRLIRGEPLFTPWPRNGHEGMRTRLRILFSPRNLATALVCAIVATSSAYFGAFTIALALFAALICAIRRRRLVAVVPGLLVAALVGAILVVNVGPMVLYERTHSNVTVVASRAPADTESFSLKVADLVLPRDNHRISAFARLSKRYADTFPVPSERGAQALGVIGAIGFAWLLLVALAGWASGGRLLTDERHRALAALTVGAVLLATLGGVSTLISLLLFSQIRAWNRISIFIAFFALASVGLLLDRFGHWSRTRAGGRGRYRGLYVAALAGVVLIGLLDQTSPADIPAYATIQAEWRSDTAFVSGITRVLGNGALIYQYPYVPFPENPPVVDMRDYDHLKPTLHSSTLRWSYGAFRATPDGAWQSGLAQLPLPIEVRALAAIGFGGLEIDRFGYADRGHGLEQQLATLVPGPTLVSTDGRLSFFDLRPLRASLEEHYRSSDVVSFATDALQLASVQYGRGFYPEEGNATASWRWAQQRASLTITSRTEQHLVLRARIVGQPGMVTVHLPGGATDRLAVTQNGVDYVGQLRVNPGNNTLRFSTNAPAVHVPGDERNLFLQMLNTTITGPAVDNLARLGRLT